MGRINNVSDKSILQKQQQQQQQKLANVDASLKYVLIFVGEEGIQTD